MKHKSESTGREREESSQRRCNKPNSDRRTEADRVAGLHKTVGNRAVQRLATRTATTDASGSSETTSNTSTRSESPSARGAHTSRPETEQSPLRVNDPSATTEREANHVAGSVMAGESAYGNLPSIQKSPQTGYDGGEPVAYEISKRIQDRQGDGESLSPATRSFFESRLEADLGSVTVHEGTQAAELARSIGARAFTYGTDIFFSRTASAGQNWTTAHELTHTCQQGHDKSSPPRIYRVKNSVTIPKINEKSSQTVEQIEAKDGRKKRIFRNLDARDHVIRSVARKLRRDGADKPRSKTYYGAVSDKLRNKNAVTRRYKKKYLNKLAKYLRNETSLPQSVQYYNSLVDMGFKPSPSTNIAPQAVPLPNTQPASFTAPNDTHGSFVTPPSATVYNSHYGAKKVAVDLHARSWLTGSDTGDSTDPNLEVLIPLKVIYGSNQMVAGHLLNEKLGGPGENYRNLTPLSKDGNNKHKSRFEDNVKYAMRVLNQLYRIAEDGNNIISKTPAEGQQNLESEIVQLKENVDTHNNLSTQAINDRWQARQTISRNLQNGDAYIEFEVEASDATWGNYWPLNGVSKKLYCNAEFYPGGLSNLNTNNPAPSLAEKVVKKSIELIKSQKGLTPSGTLSRSTDNKEPQ